MSPDEHLEAMYEDANGGGVDTACEVDEAFWGRDRVCIITPGMSDEAVDDCTMHDHEEDE